MGLLYWFSLWEGGKVEFSQDTVGAAELIRTPEGSSLHMVPCHHLELQCCVQSRVYARNVPKLRCLSRHVILETLVLKTFASWRSVRSDTRLSTKERKV